MNRQLTTLSLFVILSIAALALGDWRTRNDYPFWWGGQPASSESLRAEGMAELIRAQAEYQQAHAQALLTMEEVRRQESLRRAEQREAFRQTRAAQAAERRERRNRRTEARQNSALAAENTDQFPETLTSSELDPQSGTLQWPALYQQKEFEKPRKDLDAAAAAWAGKAKGQKPDSATIDAAINRMHETLRQFIEKIPTAQYLNAHHYLDRLELTLRMAPDVKR